MEKFKTFGEKFKMKKERKKWIRKKSFAKIFNIFRTTSVRERKNELLKIFSYL